MAANVGPLEVFLSYAHEDAELQDKLLTHLSQLQREGVIAIWHDRQITGGREWAGDIDNHLQTAHLILLLISSDFLASEYCNDVEVRCALARHERGEARVIPIILRPADWQTALFGKLQCLPENARAVTAWRNQDKAFLAVAQGIRRVADELRGRTLSGRWPFLPRPGRSRRWLSIGLGLLLMGATVLLGTSEWVSWQRQYVDQGNELLDMGRYIEAQTAFQQALRLNPVNTHARWGAEKASLPDLKDTVLFDQQVRRLYQSRPNDPHINLFMGDLAFRLGKSEEAIQFYDKARQLHPNLAEAYFRLGVLHDQQGEWDEARRMYEKAADLSPATPKYRNNLAYLFLQKREYDEAIKQYGMNDRYPLSALEISKIYWLIGNLPQARDHQLRAIQWLEDEQIAALPQNQGPWYFEIGSARVELVDLMEKRCYASYALSATWHLLGREGDAEARLKEVRNLCPARLTDLKDVIRYDLERVAEANGNLKVSIESYRKRFLDE